MSPEQARSEADEEAAAFAQRLAKEEAQTTGIPKPTEITVSVTETDVERFGLEVGQPESAGVSIGGDGGPPPPPSRHHFQIIISNPVISGTCEQFDCVSFGGTATWSKSTPGVLATFNVSDDANCGDGCGIDDTTWDCSFWFEAREVDLTPNPCVGLPCDELCFGPCDYENFAAGVDVIICNTGIVLADSWVDSDLESGLTLCEGDCSGAWCGYTTCWIVGDTWDEPYTMYASWPDWVGAVGI